jgi:hypothetical protein
VATGQRGRAGDGIPADAHRPGGPAGAAAVGEALEDRRDLDVRQLGSEQRGPLELGGPGPAGATIQQPVMSLAEAAAGAPSAVERAVGKNALTLDSPKLAAFGALRFMPFAPSRSDLIPSASIISLWSCWAVNCRGRGRPPAAPGRLWARRA